jgi:hypothetical protein
MGPRDGFVYGQIDPDWDRMGPYIEMAMDRVESLKISLYFQVCNYLIIC